MRLPKVDELRPELVFLTAARHWCRNRTAIHSPAVFTPRSRICLKMNDLRDLANYRTEMMHTVLASYDVKIQNPGKIKLITIIFFLFFFETKIPEWPVSFEDNMIT